MENKKIKSDTDFYVYAHFTKDTGELFYIGKGKGNRYKSTSMRNKYWKYKVNKHSFEPFIIMGNLTEQQAWDEEVRLILLNKPSTNITAGGNGGDTYSYLSPEDKKRCSLKKSLSAKGKKLSKEHCEAISKGLIGTKFTLERSIKQSIRQRGVKKSQRHCKRISEGKKGIPKSAEHRKKIGDIHRGKRISKETGQKISEALKKYYREKKKTKK